MDKIINEINEYFGTECETVKEFVQDFQYDYKYTEERTPKLFEFLRWLERKQNS